MILLIFLLNSMDMDAFIKTVISTCDYIKAKSIDQRKQLIFPLMSGMYGFILMRLIVK